MNKFLQAQRESISQQRLLYVPEWSEDGENPLPVNYTAVCPADSARARSLAGKQDSPDYLYRFGVAMIAIKIRDQDGEPLFSEKEIGSAMKSLDSDVVDRVLNQIHAKEDLTEAKND